MKTFLKQLQFFAQGVLKSGHRFQVRWDCGALASFRSKQGSLIEFCQWLSQLSKQIGSHVCKRLKKKENK